VISTVDKGFILPWILRNILHQLTHVSIQLVCWACESICYSGNVI